MLKKERGGTLSGLDGDPAAVLDDHVRFRIPALQRQFGQELVLARIAVVGLPVLQQGRVAVGKRPQLQVRQIEEHSPVFLPRTLAEQRVGLEVDHTVRSLQAGQVQPVGLAVLHAHLTSGHDLPFVDGVQLRQERRATEQQLFIRLVGRRREDPLEIALERRTGHGRTGQVDDPLVAVGVQRRSGAARTIVKGATVRDVTLLELGQEPLQTTERPHFERLPVGVSHILLCANAEQNGRFHRGHVIQCFLAHGITIDPRLVEPQRLLDGGQRKRRGIPEDLGVVVDKRGIPAFRGRRSVGLPIGRTDHDNVVADVLVRGAVLNGRMRLERAELQAIAIRVVNRGQHALDIDSAAGDRHRTNHDHVGFLEVRDPARSHAHTIDRAGDHVEAVGQCRIAASGRERAAGRADRRSGRRALEKTMLPPTRVGRVGRFIFHGGKQADQRRCPIGILQKHATTLRTREIRESVSGAGESKNSHIVWVWLCQLVQTLSCRPKCH